MHTFALIILLSFSCTAMKAQQLHVHTLAPEQEYENMYNIPLYSDSLSSVFVLWIKQEVPLHKHAEHTEIVEILEGEGTMILGADTLLVRPGDHIVIPADTPHSVQVTSAKPLKVLSMQSPYFDGTDRIKLE